MGIGDQLHDKFSQGVVPCAEQPKLKVIHDAKPSTEAARAARIRPYILVHLTPYAPGCLHLQADNPKRWATFYSRAPASVIRTTLTRLGRAPNDVRVRTEDPPLTDVDLMATVDGIFAPVATICSGMTANEVTAILTGLAAAKWRPASILEPV